MVEDLFAIVCDVPERISHYVGALNSFTSNFMFFSSVESFTARMSSADVKVLVLDTIGRKQDIDEQVRWLRQSELFRVDVLFVITEDMACSSGVDALNSGASDYLSFGRVSKELTARVRLQLNRYDSASTTSDMGIDLGDIYPLEDRFLLKNALDYVHKNISYLKKISDLAAYLGKGEREINHLFSKHFGKTAFEFVRDHRISMAQKLLSKTRFSITQIADAVGYSSSANFSTAFRNAVGCTPREYRCQRLLIK